MISKLSRAYKPITSSAARFFSSGSHSNIAIVGGGTAGINVAAQLIKNGILRHQIRIFEPSRLFHYQPGWTLIGGGIDPPQKFVNSLEKTLPRGVSWIDQEIVNFDPENNAIETEDGQKHTYDQLVIAAGIKVDLDGIKGLHEALNDNNCPVATIYTLKSSQKWSRIRENFEGNKAVFTQPPQPVKCAGAPQKIAYLSHDTWVNKKRLHPEINFYSALPTLFSQPDYSKQLEQIAEKKGIQVNLKQNLVEVRGNERVAVFKGVDGGNETQVKFDALHVVPPQRAHDFLKQNSSLTNEAGFVEVDQNTLQSTRYSNVWALGDCANLNTSKTAAAVTAQTPVLVHNLLKVRQNKNVERSNLAGYFGYTSCPLTLGENKLLLAEFKYGLVKDETFGPLQNTPNSLLFLLKRHVFPFAHKHLMPRGIWYGRTGVIPPVLRSAESEQVGLYA